MAKKLDPEKLQEHSVKATYERYEEDRSCRRLANTS